MPSRSARSASWSISTRPSCRRALASFAGRLEKALSKWKSAPWMIFGIEYPPLSGISHNVFAGADDIHPLY